MIRRQILRSAIAAALWLSPRKVAANTVNETYADSDAADRWMQRWMRSPAASNGMLNVERFADRYYYLKKKIEWRPDDPHTKLSAVTVPPGFVTDFASIPRVAWSLLPPDGNYTYPAVVHDYLYWTQQTTRADADKVFQLMMKEFGIDSTVISGIYSAVRLGGGIAWENNAKLKKSGERRVLKIFPTDPKTYWEVWKKKTGVFSAEL